MKLRWRFGVVAGIFLAVFCLYPQFKMLYLRGGEWNGHFAYNDIDEVAYASYVRALIDGRPRKNYYVRESVGLACGLFITALHEMGLATLTHTPSPMGFLTTILARSRHERPFILFPVGYPAPDATVPDLTRKALHEVCAWNPTPK